jgi:hypothetical protein
MSANALSDSQQAAQYNLPTPDPGAPFARNVQYARPNTLNASTISTPGAKTQWSVDRSGSNPPEPLSAQNAGSYRNFGSDSSSIGVQTREDK